MSYQKLDPNLVDWQQVKRFCLFCIVVVFSIAVACQLYKGVLVPMGVGLFFTYLLAPVIDFISKRGLKRMVAVSLVLSVTIAVVAFGFVRIVPSIYFEIIYLVKMAPEVFDTAVTKWWPPIQDLLLSSQIMDERELQNLLGEFRGVAKWSDQVQQALTTIWQTAPQVLGTVVNIVMTPLITFFLLNNLPGIKGKLHSLTPKDLRPAVKECFARVGGTLGAVIQGQVAVAAILGLLYMIGLSVIGLQYSLTIGFVAGVCRIIPYLDVIVGVPLSVIAILSDFQGMGQLIGVGVVFLLVQSLDGMLITPRVIGERVGLHPGVVIVSIIAFGDSFGFLGVLLAIPSVAILKVLWQSIEPFYLASSAFDASYVHGAKPSEPEAKS